MKYIFLLAAFFIISFQVFSQQDQVKDETWFCLTDSIYNEIIKNNPQILKERNKLNEFIKEFIKNNPKTDETYVIPIVFHVVHMYGDENISHQQIVDAVDFMNNDFALMRSDTSMILDDFKPIAANTHLKFRLAKIDPNGNCTVGVTRTYSETTNGGGEEAKIAAPAWPTDKYLNVWVVRSLGGGAAGWSYYPGTAPEGYDGVILLYDYLGPTGASSFQRASVLTHEVGHYLNLPHTWGNSNEPGLSSNCYIDDGIEDTPNTIGHTDCNIWAVTCGSLDNVQNFMEYSYCYKMFTQGQADVMRATLNSYFYDRSNLWSPQNRIATGTNDDYEPQLCAPIADFKSNKNLTCMGMQVQYNDLSYNTDSIEYYNWTLPGSEFTNYYNPNPVVTYSENGAFDAQLYVENSTDSDTKLLEDYIKVYDIQDGFSLPYTEEFEHPNFPIINLTNYNDFIIMQSGNSTWERTNYGYSGKAIRIQNKYNDYGTKNKIYLPNLKIITDSIPVTVSFKAAYGRLDSEHSDKLKFYVSNSCGDSLRLVWLLSGNSLTSTYVNQYENYIPDETDWKTHTFNINPIALKGKNLRLIIEAETNNGHTIYIDDVNFSQNENSINNHLSNLQQIEIYPNPADDELYIQTGINSDFSIYIFDISGKILGEAKTNEKIFNASNLIRNLKAGIYFIKIQSGDSFKVFKFSKS